jgi:transcriptional regulator GlxA family with amidase domain
MNAKTERILTAQQLPPLSQLDRGIKRFGFLLVPKYSMMAFSAAIEPLTMANYLSHRNLYEWPLFTQDGNPVMRVTVWLLCRVVKSHNALL